MAALSQGTLRRIPRDGHHCHRTRSDLLRRRLSRGSSTRRAVRPNRISIGMYASIGREAGSAAASIELFKCSRLLRAERSLCSACCRGAAPESSNSHSRKTATVNKHDKSRVRIDSALFPHFPAKRSRIASIACICRHGNRSARLLCLALLGCQWRNVFPASSPTRAKLSIKYFSSITRIDILPRREHSFRCSRNINSRVEKTALQKQETCSHSFASRETVNTFFPSRRRRRLSVSRWLRSE